MSTMATMPLPVARSPKKLQSQMLHNNRFLGLHQAWLGAFLSPFVLGTVALFNEDWQWWWILPTFLLCWGFIEVLFLRRRLAIRRLAVMESRAEVIRLAWKHGVSLREIRVVDDEA
ncbi:hypothetical protein FGL86_13815 [Pistricoccus aurantiacus]|uniref:Uncharacterized protein n=1 Tax=Pistricoccus aurantiacus TaxID=1883414 RepID=A0A5B8SV96_9GAMM|nr:hypothetical protein [Pistricoccus aurantiacus]QEA40047.1 hypothetical protein FGL86_13815 [Pistricoccus aurantiacus]